MDIQQQIPEGYREATPEESQAFAPQKTQQNLPEGYREATPEESQAFQPFTKPTLRDAAVGLTRQALPYLIDKNPNATLGERAIDTAKGAGEGLGKLVTAPLEVGKFIGQNATEELMHKLSGEPDSQANSRDVTIPSTMSMLGLDYEPKTATGNRAEAFTEVAPGLLKAPTSVAASNSNAAFNAAKKAAPQVEAQELVKQVLSSSNIKPEDIASELERLKGSGLPAAVIDAAVSEVNGVQTGGHQVQDLAKIAAKRSANATNMTIGLSNRSAYDKQRIGQAFDELISPGDVRGTNEEQLLKLRQEAHPAYEQAYMNKGFSPDIEQAIQIPQIQQGIQHGFQMQRLEDYGDGYSFNPHQWAESFDAEGNPVLSEQPNMRLLNAGRKGLKALGEKALGPNGEMTTDAMSYFKARDQLRDSLYAVNPELKAADQAYGEPKSIQSALEKGLNAHKYEPEELHDFVNGNEKLGVEPASEAQKSAYYTGLRRNLQNTMDPVKTGNASSLWNTKTLSAIDASVPEEFAGPLKQYLADEHKLATNDSVLRNTTKTPEETTTSGGTKLLEKVANTAMKFGFSPKAALARSSAQFLQGTILDRASTMSPEVADEVQRILTSHDPEVIRALGGSNGLK